MLVGPAVPQCQACPESAGRGELAGDLTISYVSPAFFKMVFLALTPVQALLLCASLNIYHVSLKETFHMLLVDGKPD